MSETYGKEYGEVVEHLACPRCDSNKAVVRSKPSSEKVYVDTLTCPKCHLARRVGFTTEDYFLDRMRLLRFYRIRDRIASTPVEKARIQRRIDDLERSMSVYGTARTDLRFTISNLQREKENIS